MYTGIFGNNPLPLSIISIHTNTPESIFIWPLGGRLLGYRKILWLRQGDMMALHRVLLIGAIFITLIAAVFVFLFHPFILIFCLCPLKQAISKISNTPQHHNTYYRVHYAAWKPLEVSPKLPFWVCVHVVSLSAQPPVCWFVLLFSV